MSGNRKVFLHFLKFSTPDLCVGIFLAIDDVGLQRSEHFRKCHRCRVGAIELEHLDPPGALGRAQLDALEVLGLVSSEGLLRFVQMVVAVEYGQI